MVQTGPASPRPRRPRCAVAECGAARVQRAYCAEHAEEARLHDAATKIQSLYKGVIARKSYDSLICEKIMAEEAAREAEERKREEERDSILDGLEANALRRRESTVSLHNLFQADNHARIVQYALRWRIKARRKREERAKAENSEPAQS